MTKNIILSLGLCQYSKKCELHNHFVIFDGSNVEVIILDTRKKIDINIEFFISVKKATVIEIIDIIYEIIAILKIE
ncbi:MAG: hypothetical protein V8R56_07795 [Eubacterium sp.]